MDIDGPFFNGGDFDVNLRLPDSRVTWVSRQSSSRPPFRMRVRGILIPPFPGI
jgi:hypothetical protein